MSDSDVSQASEDRQRLEDAALIRAVMDNQAEAIQRFGHRLNCVPRILAVQNRRMGRPLGRDDLADVTQESLIVIWRKLGEFDPDTSFESWVYRICYLELMNHLRKLRRRKRLLDEAAEQLQAEDGQTAEQKKHQERFELLYMALGVLAEEEARIIRMYHFEERTFKEVGDELEIPMGTAKTRYYRGITKLKEYVLNHEQEGRVGSTARN